MRLNKDAEHTVLLYYANLQGQCSLLFKLKRIYICCMYITDFESRFKFRHYSEFPLPDPVTHRKHGKNTAGI